MTGFIIDLDGTVYSGSQLISGADQFIRTLESKQVPYLFVTNNSVHTPQAIADKLAAMGIMVKKEQVFTSALAAVTYVQRQPNKQKVSLVGGNGLRKAFAEAGFDITHEGHPDVVVQGLDPSFSYETLHKCVNDLLNGADYILTNPDALIPTDGGFSPGAGSLASAIQTASQVDPVLIGKPSPIIMKQAIEYLGVPSEDVCVVGDNLLTDIQAGWKAGCRTAWVMTGVATQQQSQQLLNDQPFHPDFICANLMECLSILD